MSGTGRSGKNNGQKGSGNEGKKSGKKDAGKRGQEKRNKEETRSEQDTEDFRSGVKIAIDLLSRDDFRDVLSLYLPSDTKGVEEAIKKWGPNCSLLLRMACDIRLKCDNFDATLKKLRSSEEKLEKVSERLHRLQGDHATQSVALNTLKGEHGALYATYKGALGRNEKLQREKREMWDRMNAMKAEVAQVEKYKKRYDKAVGAMSDLQKQVEMLQSKVALHEKRMEDMKGTAQKTGRDNIRLQHQLDKAIKDLECCQDNLNSKGSEK